MFPSLLEKVSKYTAQIYPSLGGAGQMQIEVIFLMHLKETGACYIYPSRYIKPQQSNCITTK